ncbi:hypothetical protein D3C71_1329580 [compost metagenome]
MPAERNGRVSTPWALVFSNCLSVVGVSYSDSAIKVASTSLADQAELFCTHCETWKKMTSAPAGAASGNGQCRWMRQPMRLSCSTSTSRSSPGGYTTATATLRRSS